MLKSKKRILELSIVLVSALIVALGNFLFKIITANVLDVENYGHFISLLATITLFSTLVGAGLSDYWLEIFSKLKEEANASIRSSFVYLSITYIFVFLTLLTYMSVVTYPISINYIICIVLPSTISGTVIALLVSLFRVERKHIKSSLILVVPAFVNMLVFFPELFTNQKLNLEAVVIRYAFSNTVILIMALYLLIKKVKFNSIKREAIWPLTKIFKGSFYYGLSAFFYMIYYQGDILIINLYESGEEVALYSVGFTLVSVSFILASVVCNRYFLPELHSSYSTDKIVYLAFIQKVIPLIALCSGAVYILYIYAAKEIVLLFYGENYINSEKYISILAIFIPIKYISLGLDAAITASGNVKVKTKVMIVLSMVNVILNLIFVPFYGAVSAAYTTVICELMLMLIFIFKVKNLTKRVKFIPSRL